MLPREMALSSVSEIGRVFGDDFARQVARLEPAAGRSGAIRVRMAPGAGERPTEGGRAPLAEVREAAQREWQAAKGREVVDATYAKLRGEVHRRDRRAGAP
jgi:hypothetical protein